MIPASRWAAMRAILMFHNCERQSHKTVSTDHKHGSVLLTSTETIRFISDEEKREGGMEVGEEGDYIPIATLSPPE